MPSDDEPPVFHPDDIPAEDLIRHNFLNRHRFPATYNPDFLVLGEQAGSLEIQAVNAFLAERGYSGRLELPAGAGGVVPVATVTGTDAKDIYNVVRVARSGDARLPQLELNYRYQRATYENGYFDSDEDLHAAGRVWGHGFAFISNTSNKVPSAPPWKPPEHGRRPVIAVLDCGVDVENPWFPADEFLIEQWDPPTPVQVIDQTPDGAGDVEASHGTFIAGLIRTYAPDAQVRSLRIMRADGGADETNVVEALSYLLKSRGPVDVVQMSFGREVHKDDDTRLLDKIKELLGQLAGRGVQLVASAGNNGTEERCYPAAFAAEGIDMHSVGSGSSEDDHDIFSNHGSWVHDWFPGADQIGPLLHRRWGKWSGTSFAVPRCAATLVSGVFPKQSA